jgi:hypothetical protein
MELLTNQIVMKLMFKPKVAALRQFESKVTSSIQNQKSSIGQVKPSPPQLSGRQTYFSVPVRQPLLAVSAEE